MSEGTRLTGRRIGIKYGMKKSRYDLNYKRASEASRKFFQYYSVNVLGKWPVGWLFSIKTSVPKGGASPPPGSATVWGSTNARKIDILK